VKIRPLPDIDLARIASLPKEQQRKPLEQMRDGRPPFTYGPLRTCFHDIFNVQPEMFGLVEPTAWPIVEGRLQAKCRSAAELKANVAVARGLHDFATTAHMLGRAQEFSPLSISTGQRVSYWLPMVLSHEGQALVPFIEPRQSRGLTRAARRFVFSMMHEHIRAADPDYEAVRMAIFQFSDPNGNARSPILYTDENVELIALADLEAMVSYTYALWQDICQERDMETHRRAGGAHGPLL
jgi:hypothetical protein